MCHILYLDDERIILDLGREYLETEVGCKVDTTTSPDEAIALFTQNDYDCIISDYMMPDLSGVEFLKIVREKNSKIPFVFFTGKAELNVAIDAVNLGADFFLQKDPDPLLRLFELSRFITQSTTRYRKEIELEKREQLFRTVADYTYDWEYWTGIDGRFIYTSPSCERITGYSAQEFYNNPDLLISIIDPEDREIWKNHIIESEADNHPYSLDIRVIHKKGTTIWINHLCSAIYDEQGQFLGRRGSNRDITEKKLAEVEICESEKALKTIFDNQQAMMIIDASNHTIVRANQEALNLIGLPENDVIGKECHTFICPEGRGNVRFMI
ncbi:MAG: PAS domain S-box protein [Methanomicrobiales archaeon]|nr:PAS domain S-box protein [Methanomicrobiales archaeon]